MKLILIKLRFQAIMDALHDIQQRLADLDAFVRANAEHVDAKLDRIIGFLQDIATSAERNHLLVSSQLSVLREDMVQFERRSAKGAVDTERQRQNAEFW